MSAARPAPGPDVPDPAVPPPGRLSIVLVDGLFALLHGYPQWIALSNLIALPGVYELLGIGEAVPWWLLVIGVVAPVLLFTVALLLGRRRSLAHRVLLLAVSLGATNAIALSNLIALPGVYELLGIGEAVPWGLLVIGVVAPVLLFTVALLLGRRRSLAHRVLLLAVSLGTTNAIALSAAALVAALQPALA